MIPSRRKKTLELQVSCTGALSPKGLQLLAQIRKFPSKRLSIALVKLNKNLLKTNEISKNCKKCIKTLQIKEGIKTNLKRLLSSCQLFLCTRVSRWKRFSLLTWTLRIWKKRLGTLQTAIWKWVLTQITSAARETLSERKHNSHSLWTQAMSLTS